MSAVEYVTLQRERPALARHELPADAPGDAVMAAMKAVRGSPLMMVHVKLKPAKDRVHLWHKVLDWASRPVTPAPEGVILVDVPMASAGWKEALGQVSDKPIVWISSDRTTLGQHKAQFERLAATLREQLHRGEAAEAALWTGIAEDVVADDAGEPDVDAEAFRRAVERRDWLIAKESWQSSEELAQGMRGTLVDSNANQFAYQLRQTGQIFGVRHQRKRLHPGCQFHQVDGRLEVLPVMRPLLELLPKDDSGWTQAFWLFQPTGRLGGARPADMLATQPDDVLIAAKKDFHGDDGI